MRERFESRFRQGAPDECWPWLYGKDHNGYGRIWVNGKARGAHRIAYELAFSDPGLQHVLHRCDNPSCVNPAHLFLGTNADNMRDRSEKRRVSWAKLDKAAVRTIRVERKAGVTLRALAERFGVSIGVVSKVEKGRTFKYEATDVL